MFTFHLLLYAYILFTNNTIINIVLKLKANKVLLNCEEFNFCISKTELRGFYLKSNIFKSIFTSKSTLTSTGGLLTSKRTWGMYIGSVWGIFSSGIPAIEYICNLAVYGRFAQSLGQHSLVAVLVFNLRQQARDICYNTMPSDTRSDAVIWHENFLLTEWSSNKEKVD